MVLFPPSGAILEIRGDIMYLVYGALRLRWDEGGMWHITLQERPRMQGSTDIGGLCGNFDEYALSEYLF